MKALRISLIQSDIAWEDKQENLRRLRLQLEKLSGTTEIVVLPEMFSTGFTMNVVPLAEPNDGLVINTLKQWAGQYQLAIAGSHIAQDVSEGETRYYNRAFFLTPEGECHFCDKRHLFRMGHEAEVFTSGSERRIISYRGWNILLLVCYDLRFPVWSRNIGNEYDLLIYVANWPSSRRQVWNALLQARSIENMSYVCGVNRIGVDGNGLQYNGGSAIYSPKGVILNHIPDNIENCATTLLDPIPLQQFREKFPVWKDADYFSLLPGTY